MSSMDNHNCIPSICRTLNPNHFVIGDMSPEAFVNLGFLSCQQVFL